jgi:hypothetical protein
VVGLVLLLTGAVGTRAVADPEPRPRLEMPQPEYMAGTVVRGKTIEVAFPIRNTGNAPLELEMRSGCGCFVTAMDKELAPGAAGTVKIQLHTIRLHGELEKHLRLGTNDPDQPTAILTIRGVIAEPLEFAPGQRLTLPFERGRPVVKEIEITAPETLAVDKVTPSAPFLRARAVGAPTPLTDAGSTLTLEVTVDPDAAPAQFTETVTLTTRSALFPQITITVEGHLKDAIQVSPPLLRLGAVSATATDEVTRFVTLTGTGSFRILRAAAEEPSVSVEVTQVGTEPVWVARVTAKGPWAAGTHRGVIRIETDDARQPVIELPYEVEVASGGG